MVFLIFVLATFTFAFSGLYLLNKKQKVKRRLKQFALQDTRNQVNNKENEQKTKKLLIRNLIERVAKNIRTSDSRQNKIENQLISAGIPLKVEEFIIIRLATFALTIVIAFLFGVHVTFAILIGFIGWILPLLYLNKKRDARISAFAEQLPQSLEMMANAMKSGFSFMQAMKLVSKELPDPISGEFQQTINEINLGISTEAAFENLLKRIPDKDLEIVVTAVLIQRSTGGNLAQILETIHETISERVKMKDELKALTSQGRMSALIITLLPVILGILLNVMNPDYFTPMFSHPLGWVLLGGGTLSGIMGWIFIKKVVTIEV